MDIIEFLLELNMLGVPGFFRKSSFACDWGVGVSGGNKAWHRHRHEKEGFQMPHMYLSCLLPPPAESSLA